MNVGEKREEKNRSSNDSNKWTNIKSTWPMP